MARVLPQCRLQEEDRDPTGEEEDEVGDEEGTWQIQAADRRNKAPWGDWGQAISNLAQSRFVLVRGQPGRDRGCGAGRPWMGVPGKRDFPHISSPRVMRLHEKLNI